MSERLSEDEELLLGHRGDDWFRELRITILLTLRIAVPDQVEENYLKVIRKMAEVLREEKPSTTH